MVVQCNRVYQIYSNIISPIKYFKKPDKIASHCILHIFFLFFQPSQSSIDKSESVERISI